MRFLFLLRMFLARWPFAGMLCFVSLPPGGFNLSPQSDVSPSHPPPFRHLPYEGGLPPPPPPLPFSHSPLILSLPSWPLVGFHVERGNVRATPHSRMTSRLMRWAPRYSNLAMSASLSLDLGNSSAYAWALEPNNCATLAFSAMAMWIADPRWANRIPIRQMAPTQIRSLLIKRSSESRAPKRGMQGRISHVSYGVSGVPSARRGRVLVLTPDGPMFFADASQDVWGRSEVSRAPLSHTQ